MATLAQKKTKKPRGPRLARMPKSPLPKTVSPMLATLIDKPFDEPGWIYEIKWDGYRAIAICSKSKVELISRNYKSFNDKFYPRESHIGCALCRPAETRCDRIHAAALGGSKEGIENDPVHDR